MGILKRSRGVVLLLIGGVVAALVGFSAGTANAPAAPGGAGTVLAVRDITDQEDAQLAGSRRAISVTYLSSDAKGELAPVKGTVYIPSVAPRQTGYRIYSYAHGSAGIGDNCTVTDRLGTGTRFDDWLGQWLADGYVIAATEYQGLGTPGEHPYVHGETAGKNVIDMVRAARTVVQRFTGTSADTSYVTGGASQGGHASIWATALASKYAPELHNVGGVPSAPAASVDHFALVAPKVPPIAIGDYVTYTSFVLAGLNAVHPEVNVDSYLTPLGRKIVRDATTLCYAEQSAATANVALGDIVARPFAQGSLMPKLRAMMNVPATGYGSPMLVQQGALDQFSFAAETQEWAQRARANGAEIDLRIYPDLGHGLAPETQTTALRWTNAHWR